jgi:hypothetical protein
MSTFDWLFGVLQILFLMRHTLRVVLRTNFLPRLASPFVQATHKKISLLTMQNLEMVGHIAKLPDFWFKVYPFHP